MKQSEVQVDKEHYYKSYDSELRFASYFQQCKTILDLGVKNLLEIGVGNKLVSNYLKEFGMNVTTMDFDPELKPDIVGDIMDMKEMKDNSFEVVAAFEVLEHLKWENVDLALAELNRVTKKYVVISVPWSGWYWGMHIRNPFIQKIFKKTFLNIGYFFPRFYANPKWKGEHYWEIGAKDYSLKKVTKKFAEYFKVENVFKGELSPYHQFFILRKE